MLGVFAVIKRDRAGSQRSTRTSVWIFRYTQTSPIDAAGKTKAIEPFRIVLGNPCGEDRGFPRGQWQLASVELFKNRLQAFKALDTMFLIGALPREEKTIKILL